MAENPLVEALVAAVDALEAADIDYAITGSFAAAHHGSIRATVDVDMKIDAENLESRLETLARDLRERGFRALNETVFRYHEQFDVDLYPVTAPMDREAFSRRIRARILKNSEREFWLVTAEDLILLKLREYRKYPDYKHVDDVKRILVANRETLDLDYLETRLKKHGFVDSWRQWLEPGP